MLNWEKYLEKFDAILSGENTTTPYNKESYTNYTKLNNSRVKRWSKTTKLSNETVEVLENLSSRQKWILITEPWCGDTANTVPIINLMAQVGTKIDFEIHLRDSKPHLIDSYLTNGGKSIPMLIIRDENDKDLYTWGPRPAEAQKLAVQNKELDLSADEKNIILQNWYRADKGESTQKEIIALIKNHS